MLKRFCDFCDFEVPETERFYDIHISVFIDKEGDCALEQFHQEACYTCTSSGDAMKKMFAAYEKRRSKKDKK